jgi:hypothetical protein
MRAPKYMKQLQNIYTIFSKKFGNFMWATLERGHSAPRAPLVGGTPSKNYFGMLEAGVGRLRTTSALRV